jgi:hypothetical protein
MPNQPNVPINIALNGNITIVQLNNQQLAQLIQQNGPNLAWAQYNPQTGVVTVLQPINNQGNQANQQ